MTKKYIHYCWFGGKPLPKLAKKCIHSWQKYLPDYEIKRWDETNTKLEECPFVKEAYEAKKWAFVADYVRTKALYEYGGIYFDTDMEVLKDITDLFQSDTFLGMEDTGYVAVGVWYEKNKNAYLPGKLLEKYQKMKHFDIEKVAQQSIPLLISNILEKDHIVYGANQIQRLNHGIWIYPRDYFYPYSYNRDNNIFTNNTCMIHYYDASWIPARDRMENLLVRKVGRKKAVQIIKSLQIAKSNVHKVGRTVLFPVVMYRDYKVKQKKVTPTYLERVNKTIQSIAGQKKSPYLTFYNNDWLGVTSATKELFENLVDCGEIYRYEDAKKIAEAILQTDAKQVIFSSFALGWYKIATYLKKKNKNIKIKTFWHGSNSQVLEGYGWERNLEIIRLHQKNIVDVMGTCKKSLLNFYKEQGYDAFFLTNIVNVDKKKRNKVQNKKLKIGLYAANCNDWRKNMYTQMGAIKLLGNATLDMVPLSEEAQEFAELIDLEITGEKQGMSREKLFERMAQNDLNLYVTFSECAPMLPLESMEMGVPCLTGNNHHYFKGIDLENWIVVKQEDNALEIKEKIEKVLKNRQKIIDMYEKFSNNNKEESRKQIEQFLAR